MGRERKGKESEGNLGGKVKEKRKKVKKFEWKKRRKLEGEWKEMGGSEGN